MPFVFCAPPGFCVSAGFRVGAHPAVPKDNVTARNRTAAFFLIPFFIISDTTTMAVLSISTVLPELHPLRNCTASAEYFVILQGGGRKRSGPPLTDDNAADGKIGSAGSAVSGWMEH